MKSWQPYGCIGVVLVIALVVNWQVLGFEYVWDDSLIFVERTSLLNEPLSWKLLSQPVLAGTTYMRPLVFLTWYLEFNWFGQIPALSHGVNLALYLCNVTLVFLLTLLIANLSHRSRPYLYALLAGLLYGLHPALVETTAWISGRFDQMAALFMLIGSYGALRWGVRSVFGLIVYSFSFSGAVLSKELGLVLPAIILCLQWWHYHLEKSRLEPVFFTRYIGPLLITTVVLYLGYFMLRKLSMGSQYHASMGTYWLGYTLGNLLPLEALKFYLYKALFPFGLTSLFAPINDLQPFSIRSLIEDVCVLAMLAWLVRKAFSKPSISVMLSWAAFFGVLLVLHFVPLSNSENIGNERFMALPLAFFVIAAVMVDYRGFLKIVPIRDGLRAKIAIMLIATWLCGALLTTLTLVPVWRSEFSLWLWAYKQHPNEEIVQNNYLNGAFSKQRYDLIESYFEDKLKNPQGLSVVNQMHYATLLLFQGNEETIKYMEGVMFALPKFHQREDGKAASERFLVATGQMAGFYHNYAIAQFIFNGDFEKAAEYFDIAEFYLDDSEQMRVKYSKVALLYAQGKRDQAISLYRELQKRKHYQKHKLSATVMKALNGYCGYNPDKVDVCELARGEKIFAQ